MRIRGFDRLARFFALPPNTVVRPEIAQHYQHNFIVNVIDQTFWLFGVSFNALTTILPVYAAHFTSSPLVLGLIPALGDAGWFLPQLILAPFVEKLPRKKPLLLVIAAIERIPFVLLAVMAFFLPNVAPSTAIILLLSLITIRSIISGFSATPWQELMAKIIPVNRRGRFFGLAQLLGGLLAVAGSALAAYLLATFPYPYNYVWTFAVGAGALWISYAFTSRTREPAIAPLPNDSAPNYLQRLKDILRHDVNFRNFLLARWALFFGGMAFGFIAVYGVTRFHLPDSSAGVFTAILYGASMVGSFICGPLGDRFGHKLNMELSNLLRIGALLIALFVPSEWGIYVVFVLMGFSNAAGLISDITLAMEFGPEAERPTYVGLARTTTGPALLIAPLVGGWLAQSYGYETLFYTSLAFTILAAVMFAVFVKEPRKKML